KQFKAVLKKIQLLPCLSFHLWGNMMNNKVRNIHKNARYKVLEVDEEYYILDMTSTYWLFILPFLNWFISYKGYKIDKSIVKEIQSYKGSDASAVVIIATGFAVTMTFILRPIFNELTLHTSYGFNLTLLILSMLITILIRILRHYRLKSKMKQHFSIESMPITLLKVREFKAIYHLTYVIRYIIFSSVTFVTLGGVIADS